MQLTDAQIAKVQSYLEDHHDQFRSYTESDADTINLFKSGEVVLSDGGRGTALAAQQAGLPVKWIAPKERPLSWVCGLGIPSQSKNIPGAYKMINYYLSPETQAASGGTGLRRHQPEGRPGRAEEVPAHRRPG